MTETIEAFEAELMAGSGLSPELAEYARSVARDHVFGKPHFSHMRWQSVPPQGVEYTYYDRETDRRLAEPDATDEDGETLPGVAAHRRINKVGDAWISLHDKLILAWEGAGHGAAAGKMRAEGHRF